MGAHVDASRDSMRWCSPVLLLLRLGVLLLVLLPSSEVC
jgi:hypothetical protein